MGGRKIDSIKAAGWCVAAAGLGLVGPAVVAGIETYTAAATVTAVQAAVAAGQRMSADQQALKELVDEATNGARRPLSVENAETVIEWAQEYEYPGFRAGPGDVGSPSNWPGGGYQPHTYSWRWIGPHPRHARRNTCSQVRRNMTTDRGDQICGFVVVRVPDLSTTSALPGAHVIRTVGSKQYAGVDRNRWMDVFDDDYYSGRAAIGIRELADQIKEANDDFSGVDVIRDASIAQTLLAYSNRSQSRNELIVVGGLELSAIKGSFQCSMAIDWLGWDVVRIGEWSLIAAGIFEDPGYFAPWASKLNDHGLLDFESLHEYGEFYDNAAAAGKAEPLAPLTALLKNIPIEVGRVRFQNS